VGKSQYRQGRSQVERAQLRSSDRPAHQAGHIVSLQQQIDRHTRYDRAYHPCLQDAPIGRTVITGSRCYKHDREREHRLLIHERQDRLSDYCRLPARSLRLTALCVPASGRDTSKTSPKRKGNHCSGNVGQGLGGLKSGKSCTRQKRTLNKICTRTLRTTKPHRINLCNRAPSYAANQRVWLADCNFNHGFPTRYRSPKNIGADSTDPPCSQKWSLASSLSMERNYKNKLLNCY
jgi:hypothetical protein